MESIDFMLNNKGTDLAFTLGDVDALTAKVFNQVDSGEFANFTSGLVLYIFFIFTPLKNLPRLPLD